MNTYQAFYRGKSIQLEAESSYKAQQLAATLLKARKSYDVAVVLVAKDGEQVSHSTGGI
jgi:hypothetical protein